MITDKCDRSILFATLTLICAVSSPTRACAARTKANPQDTTAARRRTHEVNAESQAQKAENTDFLKRFRSLPPEARVEIWKQSNDDKYRGTVAFRVADKVQDLLIIEGTDAVPQLASTIHNPHERYFYRFWATKILADMDRYVPEEDFPKGAVATLVITELNLRGAISPFLQVTGRRIGEEGRKTLEWAANQPDDKWLQFFARNTLGLVKEQLERLTIDEQVRQWRDLVAQMKGVEGRPESFLRETFGRLIVERAPESLSPLLDLLNNDRDRRVRTSVVGLIREVDVYRFRLRKTELGRSAIEDVRTAVLRSKVKLQCPTCDTPAATWTELSDQFYKDDFGLNPGTSEAFYAQMLHTLYGESTVRVVRVGDIRQEWAVPEFTAFITFLTDQDPFFPSWEYTYFGPSNSEVFQPKFAEKMARLENAWKLYQNKKMAASVP